MMKSYEWTMTLPQSCLFSSIEDMFLFVVVTNVLLLVEVPSDVQQGSTAKPIRRPDSAKRENQKGDLSIKKCIRIPIGFYI